MKTMFLKFSLFVGFNNYINYLVNFLDLYSLTDQVENLVLYLSNVLPPEILLWTRFVRKTFNENTVLLFY